MPIGKAPRSQNTHQIVSIHHLIAKGEAANKENEPEEEQNEVLQLEYPVKTKRTRRFLPEDNSGQGTSDGEVDSEDDDDSIRQPEIAESDLWMVKYEELAQKTRTIPLSHLGCCKEGAALFNDLCMWVDVNQKYVDLGLFPQWYDIARELNIDQMKTEWVKVCVRPEQSFTRAILEIYMNDGGSLGDVITALKKQRQYRIIQEISAKAEEFLDVYTVYYKSSYNPTTGNGNHLYSIMKTLYETFDKMGGEDPLGKYQQFSKGFKHYLMNLSDKNFGQNNLILNHVSTIQTAQLEDDTQDSGYTSPHPYSGYLPSLQQQRQQAEMASNISTIRLTSQKLKLTEAIQQKILEKADIYVRILLVFSDDGVDEADSVVTSLNDFVFEDNPVIKIDVFRLNEIDLWNAMLLNPEACLVKWLDEMDYVMPILTPNFLRDLHQSPDLAGGPPAPTSPLINKYIYTLLRSEYVSNGSQNQKVRPLLPRQYEGAISRSKPLVAEPLFKMWKYTDKESVTKRMIAMLKIWCKSNGY